MTKPIRDVLPELVLMALGSVVLYHCMSLPMGSLRSPGPGLFPTAISMILILLAVISMLKSSILPLRLTLDARSSSMIILSFIAFAMLLETLGLIPAVCGCVIASRWARPRHNWTTTLILAAGMAVFVSIVFVGVLKVPLDLW